MPITSDASRRLQSVEAVVQRSSLCHRNATTIASSALIIVIK